MGRHSQISSALTTKKTNRLLIWHEGAAKRSLGGGLVCLAGLVLRELRATSRWIKGPLWAADGAWPGLEEGEGDGDGQAHKDCLHPPPSPIDPRDSTATEESPVVGLEGGRWGSGPRTAGLQRQGPTLRERPNLLLMEYEYTP